MILVISIFGFNIISSLLLCMFKFFQIKIIKIDYDINLDFLWLDYVATRPAMPLKGLSIDVSKYCNTETKAWNSFTEMDKICLLFPALLRHSILRYFLLLTKTMFQGNILPNYVPKTAIPQDINTCTPKEVFHCEISLRNTGPNKVNVFATLILNVINSQCHMHCESPKRSYQYNIPNLGNLCKSTYLYNILMKLMKYFSCNRGRESSHF